MKRIFGILAAALVCMAVSCSKEPKADKAISEPSEPVDLGLSVNWAQCNLGATTPEGFGDYYAWAGTEYLYQDGFALEDPQEHWKLGKYEGYCYANCPYQDNPKAVSDYEIGETSKMPVWSKYYKGSGKIILDKTDDAAHVVLGKGWRMPTVEDFKELIEHCKWTWTTINGVEGYKIQSNMIGFTDNWIFLPAAGRRHEKNFSYSGSEGQYWTSEVNENYDGYAMHVFFDASQKIGIGVYIGVRESGRTIRPVSEK